jgi:hypothetical protein
MRGRAGTAAGPMTFAWRYALIVAGFYVAIHIPFLLPS